MPSDPMTGKPADPTTSVTHQEIFGAMAIIRALTKALIAKGVISKDDIIVNLESLRGAGSISGEQIDDLIKGLKKLP